MAKYGVTESGFVRKNYNIIEDENSERARELFGDDIDLSVASPVGLFVKMLSWKENIIWQELEKAYYANWLSTAEGENLERLVAWGGLRRRDAAQAVIQGVKFTAELKSPDPLDPPITILKGTTIRTTRVQTMEDTTEVIFFETMKDGTVGLEGFCIQLVCDTAAGSSTVTTADTGGLLAGRPVAGTGISPGTTIVSVTDPTTFEISGSAGQDLTGVTLTFNNPGVFIDCIAVKAGPTGAVPAHSIEGLEIPVTGIIDVDNDNPSIGALDVETDDELRQRYRDEGVKGAGSNVDAIRAALRDVEDVLAVSVYENTSLSDDPVSGRPPKSIECVVLGGDDINIAEAIFKSKPAGIETFGAVTITVKDSEGVDHDISFNKPTQVPIYVIVEVTVDGTVWTDTVGKPLMKSNIIEYIGGTDTAGGTDTEYEGLGIGSTIYPWKIAAINHQVAGVLFVESVLVDTIDPPVNNAILEMGSTELPRIQADYIIINVTEAP